MDLVSILLLFTKTEFSLLQLALSFVVYIIYNHTNDIKAQLSYYEHKLSPYFQRQVSFTFRYATAMNSHYRAFSKGSGDVQISELTRSILWMYLNDDSVHKNLQQTISLTSPDFMVSVNDKYQFDDMIFVPVDNQTYMLKNGLCICVSYFCEKKVEADKRSQSLDDTQEIKTFNIYLSSRTKTVEEIQEFVTSNLKLYKDWLYKVNTNKLFIFHFQRNKDQYLVDTRYNYESSKSFDNIFFEHKPMLIERLNTYNNDVQLYQRLGIQHSLGILLYGEPGCGKTSVIKAIAKHLKRSIVSVNLRVFNTINDLRALFLSQTVGNYATPRNERIYVFEEIDCITDNQEDNPFLCREYVKKLKENKGVSSNKNTSNNLAVDLLNAVVCADDKKDKVSAVSSKSNISFTTSEMLELLDGISECDDRLIIFTTNYPDLLDKAFLRPGRIDLSLHFKKLRRVDIDDFFNLWFGHRINKDDLNKINDYTVSQAEMGKLCFQYKKHPNQLIKHLVKGQK